MNKMLLLPIAGGAAAVVLALAGGPAAPVAVQEDEPGFNCYTMGNRDCGPAHTLVPNDGAVLAAANDGRVYVAWRDGRVVPATEGEALAAWESCIAAAPGGDASMLACDRDFAQGSGDTLR